MDTRPPNPICNIFEEIDELSEEELDKIMKELNILPMNENENIVNDDEDVMVVMPSSPSEKSSDDDFSMIANTNATEIKNRNNDNIPEENIVNDEEPDSRFFELQPILYFVPLKGKVK